MTRKKRAAPSRSKADRLRESLEELKLYGILAHWELYRDELWLEELIRHEEAERHRRSLERRIRNARIGRFKPMADFDWDWPDEIDRELIEELFGFDFVGEAANVVLVGPNGVGKSTIAQNLAHQAVLLGYTVRFTNASEMLNDLAAQDTAAGLGRRLRRYCGPNVLLVDEVGYLSYDSRHADLLFEVVSRRNGEKSTIVTTNRAFKEWGELFPNASCVVALIDRLVHRSEIVKIEGESYRLKEAKEREAQRAKEREAKRSKRTAKSGRARSASEKKRR